MSDNAKITLLLPDASPAGSPVKRELAVAYQQGDEKKHLWMGEIPLSRNRVAFIVPFETTVEAKVRVLDKAGNASEWSESLFYDVLDTFPPPQPSKVGRIKACEADEDAVVGLWTKPQHDNDEEEDNTDDTNGGEETDGDGDGGEEDSTDETDNTDDNGETDGTDESTDEETDDETDKTDEGEDSTDDTNDGDIDPIPAE